MSTQLPTDPRRGQWFLLRLGGLAVCAVSFLLATGLAQADLWGAVAPASVVGAASILGVAAWDAVFLARRRRHVRAGLTVPVRFDALDSSGVVVGFSLLSLLSPVFGDEQPVWVRVLTAALALGALLVCLVSRRVLRLRPRDVETGLGRA